MIIRKICSVFLCILAAALLMNSVAHAEDSVEEPGTFVEIDVEAFGKTKVKVYEGFDFINQSSAECNWKLALNGAVLSKEIYDGQAKDVFKTLGYDITWENISGDDGLPGRTMAYKLLVDSNGNRKNVFAVAVRGTSTATDIFASDIVDGGTSMFSRTTSYIVEELKAFVTICTGKSLEELEGEENYFFFTGYSLGGAVANNLSIDGTVMKLAKNDKNRIYTYTFESPHTCIAFFWMNVGEMSNAFNLKDVDDPITNLPPYLWSTTYGKDVVFSVKDLSGVILKILYPETEYNDLTEYFWGWILPCPSHHNLIGDIVYILQQGQLVDEDYIEVNINHKEIPSVSRLSEVVSFVLTNETGPALKMDSKEIYKYDDSGKLIERQTCSADGSVIEKETYDYDSKGRIKRLEQSFYYATRINHSFQVVMDENPYNVYEIDASGKLKRKWRVDEYTGGVGLDEEERNLNIGTLGYDGMYPDGQSGFCELDLSYNNENQSIDTIECRFYGLYWEERYSIFMKYDEKKNLISKEWLSEDGHCIIADNYKYDENGRRIYWEKVVYDYSQGYQEKIMAWWNEYRYNEKGDMIYRMDGGEYWSEQYFGDEIRYTIDYYDNGEKKQVQWDEYFKEWHCYYSEDGRLLRKEATYPGQKDKVRIETVYTYDESGRLLSEERTEYSWYHDDDEMMAKQSIYRMETKYYIYADYLNNDRK